MKAVWILLAMGLLAGGSWGIIAGIDRVSWSLAAQSWHAVPGHIEHHALKTAISRGEHRDLKSYRVEAEYSYQFDGQTYRNDLVDFIAGYSSSWIHHVTFNIIEEHVQAGGATTVYVNPDDPRQSVLFPEFRGVYAQYIAFGSIPFVLGLTVLLIQMRSWWVRQQFAQVDQPWLARADWRHKRLHSSLDRRCYYCLVIGAVVLGITGLVVMELWGNPNKRVGAVYAAYIMGGIGLGTLLMSACWVIGWLRMRAVVLVLEDVPIHRGQDTIVRLQYPHDSSRYERQVARLVCEEVKWVRSGNSRSFRRIELYDETLDCSEYRSEMIGGHYELPIRLQLRTSRPNSRHVGEVKYFWYIEFHFGRLRVVRYYLPVFGSSQSE